MVPTLTDAEKRSDLDWRNVHIQRNSYLRERKLYERLHISHHFRCHHRSYLCLVNRLVNIGFIEPARRILTNFCVFIFILPVSKDALLLLRGITSFFVIFRTWNKEAHLRKILTPLYCPNNCNLNHRFVAWNTYLCRNIATNSITNAKLRHF